MTDSARGYKKKRCHPGNPGLYRLHCANIRNDRTLLSRTVPRRSIPPSPLRPTTSTWENPRPRSIWRARRSKAGAVIALMTFRRAFCQASSANSSSSSVAGTSSTSSSAVAAAGMGTVGAALRTAALSARRRFRTSFTSASLAPRPSVVKTHTARWGLSTIPPHFNQDFTHAMRYPISVWGPDLCGIAVK